MPLKYTYSMCVRLYSITVSSIHLRDILLAQSKFLMYLVCVYECTHAKENSNGKV